ncbi:MAG TPA: twitching motility protein PilT [Prolixibacteraceae bacterium]|nr:twitching motility protein PilT [Prolixibacteraceae bacterium]
MNQVCFRFYEELNDYLPKELHKVWFECRFELGTSVGEKIQSLGIPLDDIDLILVNQQSKRFDYLMQDGDRISVYPEFELFDLSGISQLREKPLRNTRFICDVHLGRLCKYLRMLGLDTLYSNRYTTKEMVNFSRQEKRILLSRSYQLIRHKEVTHAYWIRSAEPLEQLSDLIRKLDLSGLANPLTRCLNCNDRIVTVEKQEILHRLQAMTAKYYTEFFKCAACDQIYWKGSHYENMLEFIYRHLEKDLPVKSLTHETDPDNS